MYNIANAINKELSMSKYQNTPSNKNKTQAEFNDSLYSNILSLISVILSVLSLVCAIWIFYLCFDKYRIALTEDVFTVSEKILRQNLTSGQI